VMLFKECINLVLMKDPFEIIDHESRDPFSKPGAFTGDDPFNIYEFLIAHSKQR
jgi:hypothetical protein